MGTKIKAAFEGPIPRWFQVIAMGMVVFFLNRMVNQVDTVGRTVESHTVSIALIQDNVTKTSEAFGKIDQIARLLEQRILILESREEANRRKP